LISYCLASTIKIIKKVMRYSLSSSWSTIVSNSACTTVGHINLTMILVTLRLIVVAHGCIKISLFTICCFTSRSSASNIRLTNILWLAMVNVLIVVSTLHILADRCPRFSLLWRISTTCCFHVVKALCLFQILKINGTLIRWP
jgi:hypothetical protein